jgi:tetratricopeptide (TPR) repeat protein
LSQFFSGIESTIRAFGPSFQLALGLVLAVALTHAVSFAWYRFQQRGQRPLVVRLRTDDDVTGRAGDRALDSRLLAYLAADGHGAYVIAPGAGTSAAPGVPAEALQSADTWMAAALHLALAREPAFKVDVTWRVTGGADVRHEAAVRVSRVPGGRIVASDSFHEATDDLLVEAVGCFCIIFLRSQPRFLRHTPRWERWGKDISGYRAYRRGLECQRRSEYESALVCFHEAARMEPGNLLVRLHTAALYELKHEYPKAAALYEKCLTLWPEHIETAYRLGSAHKNVPDPPNPDFLVARLDDIKNRLKLWNVAKCWARSCWPGHWNPGERRYWMSWNRVPLPGRISRRSEFINAVAVAKLLARLAPLTADRSGGNAAMVKELMSQLAKDILRDGDASPAVRLLHPERPVAPREEHSGEWHAQNAGLPRIPISPRRYHRSKIGWLALYNAACFFSLAIRLDPRDLPDGFDGTWSDDCARAAIRELGIIVRSPLNALDPDWFGEDPDLEPLLEHPIGQDWASFVGLPVVPPQMTLPAEPLPVREELGLAHMPLPASARESSSGQGGDLASLPITVFLSDAACHEQVQAAVNDLLESAGLEIYYRGNPRIGSWFQSMRAGLKTVPASPALREAAIAATHAAESRLVLAQDATITATLLQNLGPVIGALQPTRDAVLRLGALLIIKVEWIVAVYQLTAAQQLYLDHHPSLACSPQTIITALALLPSTPDTWPAQEGDGCSALWGEVPVTRP